ncbi:MAG TPA: hypothetical protein VEW48_29200 [Thermoanaerobaculia bacterium]|nr:hypothetical protein [Thermoanaerobaculia bacterium]
MSLQRLAIVFGVLLLPLALILSFGAEKGLYQVYVPTGYIKEVDRLIDESKLVYDCRSEQIEPRGLTDAETFFLSHSYLDDDLRLWNAGDRRPFEVERRDLGRGRCEGRVVRINESFHNQRLPAYAASTWKGRLYLRQGQPTLSLSSPDRRLEVTRAPWERLPLPASSFSDVWIKPGQGDERAEKMALKWREAGRMFASLEHVGDDVAVEVYQERPGLLLNGCPVRTGARLRLDSGDWVWLQEEGSTNEQYHVDSGDEAGLVSFVTTVNGELRRRTLGNRLEMADELTRAVDTAVVAGDGKGRNDFDVHLTLDAFFQDFLTRRLSSFCRQRYGRRPLRAAVTLLEPESGRVLALASYPTAGDLEDLRLKSDVHRVLLGENHNFLVHPIGSTTKPFLAAAALATQPRLAQLTVPCHPGGNPPPLLLGYDFGRYSLPGDCRESEAPIDFRRFLEVSSNRYMLELGLLSLAEWRDGMPVPDRSRPPMVAPDGYSLGGTPATYRPFLTVVKAEDRAGATEMAGVQDTPFYQHFRDLFGHSIHYESLPPDRTLAMQYWNPITDAAGGSGRDVALAFSPVTPERVNLRANLIQQARQDLYTGLLGLGNNRWSNLQLAESTARLLTGRKVDAHLIERVVVPPPPQEKGHEKKPEQVLWDLEKELKQEQRPPLPLAAESRQLILEGMSQVVEGSRGTAHALMRPLSALNSRAPEGVSYSALGKTGTPSTEFQVVRRSPAEPAPGAIHVDSHHNRYVDHGLLLLALTRTAGGKSESLVLTFYIEAQGTSAEAVALAGDLLQPLAEAYWPEDWMTPASLRTQTVGE